MTSSRDVQKVLTDQWEHDVDDLTKALHNFCPAWQAQESELLTNKVLQTTMLSNPKYANISLAVEILKASAKLLKACFSTPDSSLCVWLCARCVGCSVCVCA